MTDVDEDRLRDILESISAIRRHTGHRGREEVVRDAVLYRIIVLGEAVRALSDEVKDSVPAVPWRQIVRMRDMITHQYFRVDFAIVSKVVERDFAQVESAVFELLSA